MAMFWSPLGLLCFENTFIMASFNFKQIMVDSLLNGGFSMIQNDSYDLLDLNDKYVRSEW